MRAVDPGSSALVRNIVAFGRLLRRAGLGAGPEQIRLFARALELTGFDRKAVVRAAGSAVFVRRREERAPYERAFALFWRRVGVDGPSAALPRMRQDARRPPTFPAPALDPGSDLGVTGDPGAFATAASARERLRHADFASLTPDEAREALAMVSRLRPAVPTRRSRRWITTRGGGRRPARTRILRRALGTAGEPLRWWSQAHPRRPRPLVLVTDISGSMERYSRLMLRFAHALGQSGAPVEVFVFGTRLTRITRELRVRDPDTALERVGSRVVDWNGGTRIGESLRDLNRRWVRRSIRSGAVVLICSDGWERGDPALLAREMARLRRSCYRLYWLDPLASQPGFAPEVAGLAAALPHTDALIPCGTAASLEALAGRVGDELVRARARPAPSDRARSFSP